MKDITYCVEQCSLGREQAQQFLKENESISDAAIDMQMFVETCKKTSCHQDKPLIKSAKN